ncbi:MAG TPA: GNAT family N-acetyltransferase [Pseudobacteroides sp.]|uniref:GNAT family N-acetyltransferase n=1 Tax=Pseudobacteroides sp. TaxID=1968840 RepID=UPI002F9400DE
MSNKNIDDGVAFFDLPWDTKYFGLACSKAVLTKPILQSQWTVLKRKFGNYQFVSIENIDSNPSNAQMIGKDTTAFLADVNIQFRKKLNTSSRQNDIYRWKDTIKIHQNLKEEKGILEIADFKISKFTEDPELLKRGGAEVYHQWIVNSFGKNDKYFAVSRGCDNEINGFLLHSYEKNKCIVELIAVSKNKTNGGIGSGLFRNVEYAAYERGCDEIRVGTQVRNMGAINFYHKVGCEQIGCHQIYHLWNL